MLTHSFSYLHLLLDRTFHPSIPLFHSTLDPSPSRGRTKGVVLSPLRLLSKKKKKSQTIHTCIPYQLAYPPCTLSLSFPHIHLSMVPPLCSSRLLPVSTTKQINKPITYLERESSRRNSLSYLRQTGCEPHQTNKQTFFFRCCSICSLGARPGLGR